MSNLAAAFAAEPGSANMRSREKPYANRPRHETAVCRGDDRPAFARISRLASFGGSRRSAKRGGGQVILGRHLS
jgi:hypothetical protein